MIKVKNINLHWQFKVKTSHMNKYLCFFNNNINLTLFLQQLLFMMIS